MARLPYVDPSSAPQPIREVFSRLPAELNIFRMLANAETLFRPFLGLGSAILGSMQLDALARELVILHVGKLCRGAYEWSQHVPIAQACGATRAQIEALERGQTADPCFDARQRAILEFTSELVRNVQVTDGTFGTLRAHLEPREIVELVIAVGYYMTIARVTEAIEIELDAPAGMKVVESARRELA
jgi:alkylhydroperoxidase family enzyme